MTHYVQVSTTVDSEEQAQAIARSLVEDRLAACVQILGPITSIFRWQGAVETGREWLCLVKTRRTLVGRVEEAIRRAHPYQVPEIVATPIAEGHQPYLDWIAEQTE
jgi:periplasmic divalent cation tolerance protein